MKQLFLTIIIAIFLLMLQFILPQKKFEVYTDEQLRQTAISHGMKSNPNTFNKLKELYKEYNLTKENIIFGKKLFFDKNLSKNRNLSCNSCHTLEANNNILIETLAKKEVSKNIDANCKACHTMDNSGVNRATFSQGAKPHPYKLNVQTVLNSATAKYFTWGGQTKSLQDHISNSILSDYKLDMTKKDIKKRYKISFNKITLAIDSYVKTLLTRGSYDEFLDGNNSAISEEAKKGMANFINFGCKGCHTGIAIGGQSLQRFPARKQARIYDWRLNYSFKKGEIIDNSFPFKNIGGYKGNKTSKPFRVAILRNITKTSPYFHNGAIFKLRKAVDIMAKHQTGKNLNPKQIDEIVEFLKTLDGDIVDYGLKYENK